jgi:predicted anti-sigma-YlaC factor YlaD
MNHLDEFKLFSYIDNECAPAEKEAIQQHLATCPDCNRLYEELASLDTLLLSTKPLEPSAEFTDVLMSKLQVAPQPAVRGFFIPSLLNTWQLAGIVIALALLTMVVAVPGTGIAFINWLGSIGLVGGYVNTQAAGQTLLQTAGSSTLSIVLLSLYSLIGLLLLDKVFQKYLLPKLAH